MRGLRRIAALMADPAIAVAVSRDLALSVRGEWPSSRRG